MIEWDETAKTLVIQCNLEQATIEDLNDKQLAKSLSTVRKEEILDNLQALKFGISLLKQILLKISTFFGPELYYYSTVCPVWSSQTHESRFTGRKRIVFERSLLRSRFKVKPRNTDNRIKVFVQLRERIKNPRETPVDGGLLENTTCKVKLTFVEKLKTGRITLEPRMRQYLLAKTIKDKLDLISSVYPVQLGVHVDQRENKEKLIVTGELTEISMESITNFLSDLLSRLENHFMGKVNEK
ncbi:MAG: hypothetical protein ACXAEU_13550 [Candidatus Hodarchaeales archaeon]